MKISMNVKGLNAVKFNMKNVAKKMKESEIKVLEKAGKDIYKDIRKNIKDFDLVDTKDLLNSTYHTNAVNFGKRIVVEIGIKEKYGIYHEFGWEKQGIGPEMLENLREWAIRKLGVNEVDSYGVAYAIALNLSEHGHKASPFMQNALDDFRKKGLKILGIEIEASLAQSYKPRK